MEKETIEEAAERLIINPTLEDKQVFAEGAKWMQQRMYSEEEVIELLQKYRLALSEGTTPNLGDTTKEWFKNIKK